MIPESELCAIRSSQVQAMPELVDIERETRADDGFGGTEGNTWAAVDTDVPARITQAQTLDMQGQAGRKLEIEKWTVRVPYGTDLRENDRVRWGSVLLRIDEIKLRSYATAVSAAAEVIK